MPDNPRLEALRARRAAEQAVPAVPASNPDDFGIPELPAEFRTAPTQFQQPSDAAPESRWNWFKRQAGNAWDATKSGAERVGHEALGAAHAANQVATMGLADELTASAANALGATPDGETADESRQRYRDTAQRRIAEAPYGAPLGAAAAAFPLAELATAAPLVSAGAKWADAAAAAAKGGASLLSQTGAAGLGTLASLFGQGSGNPVERTRQVTQHIADHPVQTAFDVGAPALVGGVGVPAFSKLADKFERGKLGALSHLITTPTQRAHLKAVEGRVPGVDGKNAVIDVTRRAEKAGIFKGSNLVSDLLVPPTAARAADNAAQVIADSGERIGDATKRIKEAARVGGTLQDQQVDVGPTIESYRELKSARNPSWALGSEGEKDTIQNEIDYLIDKTHRPGNDPPRPEKVYKGVYSEPPPAAKPPPPESPVDVEGQQTSEYVPPKEDVKAENLSSVDGQVLRSGPEILPPGVSRNAQPNAMRFSRKALSEHTTEPTPDGAFTPPEGPQDGPAVPIGQWEREWYERAGARKPEPLAARPSDSLVPEPETTSISKRPPTDLKKPSTSLSTRPAPLGEPNAGSSSSAPGSHFDDSAQDAEFYDWNQREPINVPPPKRKQIGTGGAPPHSVSLEDAMDATADAAKRAKFDVKAQRKTSLDNELDLLRWKGAKDASRQGVRDLVAEKPDLGQYEAQLNDANADFHTAKSVQFPALLRAEREGGHALSPRDLFYGKLSGHGAAVLASRIGAGGVPGAGAQVMRAGEKGSRGGLNSLLAGESVGMPVTSGARRAVLDNAKPVADQPNSLSNIGAGLYDWLHGNPEGSQPRESVADRNKRISDSLRDRLNSDDQK